MTVEIEYGSAGAMAPAMLAKFSTAGSGLTEILCGFMPSRVSIILDGTTDMMLEYVASMSGYFKIVTGAAGIEALTLIAEVEGTPSTQGGFSVDNTQEGAGDYYVAAWR